MKKRRDKGNMEKKQEEILEEKANNEEETAANEPEAEAAADAPTDEVKAEEEDPVQKALDDANAKAAEYLQLAQRVQADFENFRRRNVCWVNTTVASA